MTHKETNQRYYEQHKAELRQKNRERKRLVRSVKYGKLQTCACGATFSTEFDVLGRPIGNRKRCDTCRKNRVDPATRLLPACESCEARSPEASLQNGLCLACREWARRRQSPTARHKVQWRDADSGLVGISADQPYQVNFGGAPL